MAARGGADLPVRDGQRRALPAVHRRRPRGRRASSRDVRTEDDLVVAWHERRDLVREVVSRSAPPMLALMDLEARARRRVLPPPPRDHARAGQGAGARAARARPPRGAEWVVLFDDVTPLGSHRLEMHVRERPRAARLVRAAARRARARSSRSRSSSSTRATARGCSTSRRLMPAQTFDTREEWEARIEQARVPFGRG